MEGPPTYRLLPPPWALQWPPLSAFIALCLASIASSMGSTVASCFSMLITALCQTPPASSVGLTVASCFSMLITAHCFTFREHILDHDHSTRL